jgi:hypothetical protein
MAEEISVPTNEETLALQTQQVADDMVATNDVDKVKDLTHMFNLLQAKKNALRMMKMGELVDLTTDQMSQRLQKKPDEFTNTELVNYLNAIQNAMDKISKGLGTVDELPIIALQQNNVTVNVDNPIDADSRERITDVVKAILAKQKQQEVVDAEFEPIIEVNDNVDNNKEEV